MASSETEELRLMSRRRSWGQCSRRTSSDTSVTSDEDSSPNTRRWGPTSDSARHITASSSTPSTQPTSNSCKQLQFSAAPRNRAPPSRFPHLEIFTDWRPTQLSSTDKTAGVEICQHPRISTALSRGHWASPSTNTRSSIRRQPPKSACSRLSRNDWQRSSRALACTAALSRRFTTRRLGKLAADSLSKQPPSSSGSVVSCSSSSWGPFTTSSHRPAHESLAMGILCRASTRTELALVPRARREAWMMLSSEAFSKSESTRRSRTDPTPSIHASRRSAYNSLRFFTIPNSRARVCKGSFLSCAAGGSWKAIRRKHRSPRAGTRWATKNTCRQNGQRGTLLRVLANLVTLSQHVLQTAWPQGDNRCTESSKSASRP
mmetsp:Transcript_79557/g.212683  ORF Transcript_79557/g.212683 Transcript_79557/m.212683 type:complete len:375 (+) Transcript_79557:400-1524(+)